LRENIADNCRYAAVPVADLAVMGAPWQQAKDKSSQSVDRLSLKISDARTASGSRSDPARVPKFAADSLQMQKNGPDPRLD
jgi:hypothetical protein